MSSMGKGSVLGAAGMAMSAISEPSWALLLVGALTLVLILTIYKKERNLNLARGPRNLPVIGAFLEVKPPLHKTFDKLAAKHGPIVHFRLGIQTVVLISSSELAEEMLKHKDHELADRCTFMNRSACRYVGFESKGLPWADYNANTKLVRKVDRELVGGAKLELYEDIRTKEIAVMVEKILNEISGPGDEKSALVEIRKAATGVTQNVMFWLNFGKRFDDLSPTCNHRKVPSLLDDRIKILMKVPVVDYFPSRLMEWLDPQGLLKVFRDLEKRQLETYGAIVEEHRGLRKSTTSSDGGHITNLVDGLLQFQEEGGNITNTGIMAAFVGNLAAGIETTAGAVEWAMLELVRQPKLLQRILEEIEGVVGKERPVLESDLPAMPLLNAVMAETLRLHPIGPFSFPHVNNKPITIGGYDVPAKTAVLLNIYSIGRDPRVWNDPLQFNPDRFMVGGQCLDQESWKRFHLVPFGGGRRACPGLNLAKLVLPRIIGTLIHAFDWSPPPGVSAVDLSTDETKGFSLRPVKDLVLRARPRLPSRVYETK